jgi:hypothetical protein
VVFDGVFSSVAPDTGEGKGRRDEEEGQGEDDVWGAMDRVHEGSDGGDSEGGDGELSSRRKKPKRT